MPLFAWRALTQVVEINSFGTVKMALLDTNALVRDGHFRSPRLQTLFRMFVNEPEL